MAARLIIDGNAVYEIDEECVEFQKMNGKLENGKSEPENPKIGEIKKPGR